MALPQDCRPVIAEKPQVLPTGRGSGQLRRRRDQLLLTKHCNR